MKLRPPIKTHGGKFYTSSWIIEQFPNDHENFTYCEPFAGGASVLLNKVRSSDEVINDLDFSTFAIWRVLKDDCEGFINTLRGIPYTEESFQAALETTVTPESPIFDIAVREYTLRRMSRGGMGQSFAWSKRLRGGKPGDQNAWETMFPHLLLIAERIKGVQIHNQDFRKVMSQFAKENVLMYMDPPYLKSTRDKGSTDVYAVEMSNVDHIDFCRLCLDSPAKILVSGYSSQLYTELLGDWRCLRRGVANHASQSKGKNFKIECLWLNF